MKSLHLAMLALTLISLGCAFRGSEWDPTYEELTSNEGAYSAEQIGIQPTELLPLVYRAAEGDHDAIIKIQPIAPVGDGAASLMDKMLLGKILQDSGDRAYSEALAQQSAEVRSAHSTIPNIEKFPLTNALT